MRRSGRSGLDLYAHGVVRLRFAVVLGWIAAALAATLFLPSLEGGGGGSLGSLVPKQAGAIANEEHAFELFGVPLITRTAIVQRDPGGLSLAAEHRIYTRAIALNRREYPGLLSVRFALPITNSLELVPSSRERGTTAITYLFFPRDLGLVARNRLAHTFAERRFAAPEDVLVGVTGAVPGRVEQGNQITEALPLIEAATILLVVLVIGFHYRSFGAPFVTLVAVAIAYLIAVRLVPLVAGRLGVRVPKEVEPLVVVLLLGIVTDYTIFLLSGLRHRLVAGEERLAAVRATTAEYLPIIATAGLTVAAGTASLLAGSVGFFRAFGPGLALTTLVGLVVAVTLVPALLAIGGSAVYWPSLPRGERRTAGADASGSEQTGTRVRIAELVASRRAAALVAAIMVALLGAAASGLLFTRLGVAPLSGLPSETEARTAAEAAAAGFSPGILSPTQIVVEAPELARHRDALTRLQQELAATPGVAGVIGPADQPTSSAFGAVLAKNGSAARYIAVLDSDPFGGKAVDVVGDLRERMPELLEQAGIPDATASFSGDTALAADTVAVMLHDLGRIAIVVVLVNLLMLALFLRSLVAPLYLLGASVLALAATLGLTTYVFQGILGSSGLTYYVPFAAAVLLVSLGSDYNILVTGRVWREARRRPIHEALAVAIPPASRAITIAGIALAASFALLAIVALAAFRQLAFTMVVGILIDAFLVRSFLVPALISLAGEASWWPGTRTARSPG